MRWMLRTPGAACWPGSSALRFSSRRCAVPGSVGSPSVSGRRLPCSAVSGRDARPAGVEDVHELAAAVPHVVVETGSPGNPVYQVGGKSFVFFRNPRPDAVDPATGERYADVIVFWVPSEQDKEALVRDPDSPFF